MYHIKECIVVEGAYDKIKLSGIVDATIFVTNGFSIFNNKKDIEAIKLFGEKCGVVILTDSDSAGFKIRNYIKQALPNEQVKHAYIPEIEGKEKRKTHKGKEGLLGVEGISDEIIINALKNAGCTIDNQSPVGSKEKVTKTDFYSLGLTGTDHSHEKRKDLCKILSLPERISANMLLDSVNSLMSKEEFFNLLKTIE